MRLTHRQIEQIKITTEKTVNGVLGAGFAGVTLFGSRVDDTKRGGDIDLMVTTNTSVENPSYLMARIWTDLQYALGEQKIDVLLDAPNLKRQPIHEVAHAHGVLL